MSDVNVAFARSLMKIVHKDVKRAFPEIVLNSKSYWVYRYPRDKWEFHGPDGFYWYGSAFNAYDARAQGWAAYLRSKNITPVE